MNARCGRGRTGERNRWSIRCARAVPCCLAGGCCSSLLASRCRPQALAQTTDPADSSRRQSRPTAPHCPASPMRRSRRAAPGRNADADEAARSSSPAFAGASQNSINIKRRERSMVEAVSAEEIGKLPDVSIAELIARLPGIAAQRVDGPRGDHLDPRLFARLHDGSAERPPAGELGLQPRGRVRPISVRALGRWSSTRLPTRALRAWASPARSTSGPFGRSNMASARSRSTCAASSTRAAAAITTFPNMAGGEAPATSTRMRAARSAG